MTYEICPQYISTKNIYIPVTRPRQLVLSNKKQNKDHSEAWNSRNLAFRNQHQQNVCLQFALAMQEKLHLPAQFFVSLHLQYPQQQSNVSILRHACIAVHQPAVDILITWMSASHS